MFGEKNEKNGDSLLDYEILELLDLLQFDHEVILESHDLSMLMMSLYELIKINEYLMK
jgi:hypothetical protein